MLIEKVELKDPKYADDLKIYLAGKLQTQRESLDIVLPTSPLYGVKESVNQMEQELTKSKTELAEVKVEQNIKKTRDIQRLVDLGEKEEAAIVADALIADLVKTAETLDEAEEEEEEDNNVDEATEKKDLSNELSDNIKALENLEVTNDKEIVEIIKDSLPEDGSFKIKVIDPVVVPVKEDLIKIENNLEVQVPDIFQK